MRTFYLFIRRRILLFAALVSIFLCSFSVLATNLYSLVVSGTTIDAALITALEIALRKNISLPGKTRKRILEAEIIPMVGQFIPSHRVVQDRGDGDELIIRARVDLDSLNAIFSLVQKKPTRAAIFIKGHKDGMPWKSVPYEEREELLVGRIEKMATGYFLRRGIKTTARTNSHLEYINFDSVSEDSGAMLRAVAEKQGLDFVLFIHTYFQRKNIKNSSRRVLRMYMDTELYDKKNSLLLASYQGSIPMSLGARAIESTYPGVQEQVDSLIKNTLYNLFIKSGRNYLATIKSQSYLTLRVLNPLSYGSLEKLQAAVAELPKVKSIVPRAAQQGRFDYWIDIPRSYIPKLMKAIANIKIEGFTVFSVINRTENSNNPTIALRMEKKPITGAGSKGEKSENKN